MCDEGSSPLIINNIISRNSVDEWGGAIDCYYATFTSINNTIVDNTAGEWGGAIGCFYGTITVRDCIIWGNEASIGADQILLDFSTGDITYTNIQGGWEGTGNINLDPCFQRGALGSCYLSFDSPVSPCIDAGSRSAEEAGLDNRTTRTDGVPDGGIVDVGFHYPITGWVVADKNEVTPPDAVEIVAFPNPFNASLHIQIVGARFSHSSLETGLENPVPTVEIYNIKGQKVEKLQSSTGQITWYPTNLPSGIYFIYANIDEKTKTQRVFYLR